MGKPFALAVRCIALVGLSFSKGNGKNAKYEIIFLFSIFLANTRIFFEKSIRLLCAVMVAGNVSRAHDVAYWQGLRTTNQCSKKLPSGDWRVACLGQAVARGNFRSHLLGWCAACR